MLTGAFNGNGTFVAKYSSAGMLVWVKQPAGYASATVVDAVGSVWVTGGFEGTLTFGAGGSNPKTLTSTGLDDLFLQKYATGPEISFDSLADLVRQLRYPASRSGPPFSPRSTSARRLSATWQQLP